MFTINLKIPAVAWFKCKASIVKTPSANFPLNMLCFTPPNLPLTPAWSESSGWDGRDCGKAQSETFTLAKQHTPPGNESAATKVIRCKTPLLPRSPITVHTLSLLLGSKTENQFIFQEKGTLIGDYVRETYFRSVLLGDCNRRV